MYFFMEMIYQELARDLILLLELNQLRHDSYVTSLKVNVLFKMTLYHKS